MTESDRINMDVGLRILSDGIQEMDNTVLALSMEIDHVEEESKANIGKVAAATYLLKEQVDTLLGIVGNLSERLKVLEDTHVTVPPVPVPDPVIPPTPPSTLIRSESWAPGSLSKYIVEAPPTPPGFVTEIAHGLRSVLHTEQTLNQAKKCKSEVYLLDKAFTKWTKPFSEPMGVPVEYRFSLKLLSKDTNGLPIDWTKVGSKIVLLQLHGIEDDAEKGFGRNPALALSVEVGGGIPCMRWRGSWSNQAVQTDNANAKLLVTVPQVIDTPLDITIKAIWSFTEAGRLKISHGTDIVVDQVGPNCFNDLYGPYWSIGQYLPAMSDPNSVLLVKRPREYVVEYGPYTVNSY